MLQILVLKTSTFHAEKFRKKGGGQFKSKKKCCRFQYHEQALFFTKNFGKGGGVSSNPKKNVADFSITNKQTDFSITNKQTALLASILIYHHRHHHHDLHDQNGHHH